jgi:hypothetical protein
LLRAGTRSSYNLLIFILEEFAHHSGYFQANGDWEGKESYSFALNVLFLVCLGYFWLFIILQIPTVPESS